MTEKAQDEQNMYIKTSHERLLLNIESLASAL